jgi:acetoin utilization deacetylase AcuC-like enzyme
MGWPRECGEGASTGCAVNMALPLGTADAGWLRGLPRRGAVAAHGVRPQLLVTQCGADTHTEDPLADLQSAAHRDDRRGLYVAHAPWLTGADRVDVAILETRRAVFPLHGLDPHDPRD